MELGADLERLGAMERSLDDLDTALRRLDDGSYWRCESCGRPIGDRLVEDPLVRRCPACPA